MADREKVIKGLEYCKHTDGVECPNCPYWHEDDCVEILHTDILALLKEQEPALPTWSQGKAYCGKCGHRLPRKRADKEINYCGYCGQAVKLDD